MSERMRDVLRIGGCRFGNPVLTASGTFGFGLEFPDVANRLGGVVTKAVTLEPRIGNSPPRIWEFPGGVINSVGLENPGIERFRKGIEPKLRRLRCRVVANIAGFAVTEFARLAEVMEELKGVAAVEVNVSCPNVQEGGALFGQSPKLVERITRAVRRRIRKPVLVKLTACFVDPLETAKAAEAGGADAVTLINTLFGLVFDCDGRPVLGGRSGGVSGPALKPFALFCVDRVAGRIGIPVVGCGGIMNGQDARDFLNAGARMVQVGTASLRNPEAALDVLRELTQKRRRQ
uniref:Dihydroorotate dehydrogenase n=1 Tax=candidate division WOR-3 bacterium TaxID=2052148 RepID=A0A7C4GDN0_UNCW3